MITLTSQQGNIFKRKSDGFLFGEVLWLSDDTTLPDREKPEDFYEIPYPENWIVVPTIEETQL